MDLRPPHDCYWVAPGKLLAGPYPGAKEASRARAQLTDFIRTGVRSFVDLTQPGEYTRAGPMRPYDALLAEVASEQGVAASYTRLLIEDTGVPSAERMREILAAIDRGVAGSGAVYVHCWGGVGRTGTVIGCWLVEGGMTPDTAFARLVEVRRDTERARRRSPENESQIEFVRRWHRPRRGLDEVAV